MRTLTPSRVLSVVIAVGLIAGAGGAVAQDLVTGRDVKNGSLSGKDVKNHSLATADLKAEAVAELRGATGPQGAPGAPGARGPGAQLLTYAHTLGYPAETRHDADLLTVGPITYEATCAYDVDDGEMQLTFRVRATTAFTVGGTLVVRNDPGATGGPFPVVDTSTGAATELVHTDTIQGSASTQRHSGSGFNIVYAGGFQQLALVAVVSPGNVCRLSGSVVAAG